MLRDSAIRLGERRHSSAERTGKTTRFRRTAISVSTFVTFLWCRKSSSRRTISRVTRLIGFFLSRRLFGLA